MLNPQKKVNFIRAAKNGNVSDIDLVASEVPLNVILNSVRIVTLLCSPCDIEDLAVGFLLAEGYLNEGNKIFSLQIDQERKQILLETDSFLQYSSEEQKVPAITSGCGGGRSYHDLIDRVKGWRITSELKLSTDSLYNLFRQLQQRSTLFKDTGGVHGAALSDGQKITVFREDIGRHNAVDKLFGRCFQKGITTNDRVVLTTGRLSSDIVVKVIRRNIPILASRSAPTSLSVELAEITGLTLVGFVRGTRLNIYTHPYRITIK